MQWWQAVLIVLAGVGAGAINAAVGSGSLITFPSLLALGVPPVSANVSNNIGLLPGGLAGAWGYRRELVGQRANLILLVPCSAVGAVVGALLLLRLPDDAFETIVPVLILVALAMVLFQPQLARRMAARRALPSGEPGPDPAPGRASIGVLLAVAIFAAGMYGGYFGAAQGVLLLGLLGWLLTDSLQVANGLKNVLASVANAVAAVIFVIIAADQVDWMIVALIAVGSTIGGVIGANVGRRLPPVVLRAVIVVVGLVAIVRLMFW